MLARAASQVRLGFGASPKKGLIFLFCNYSITPLEVLCHD
nr:MAG TPA: IS66 Orf2 like protein [Inoviridae sp.]